MYNFRNSEELLPSHTVVHFFYDPEGSLPSHTIRAFLPRSRRFASVVHSMRFFRVPEGTLLRRTVHTLLSPPRRIASVAHVVNVFLNSEESIPTNTGAYSVYNSEELFSSYAVYTTSTFPKVRFRCARLAFLLLPRRVASVALGLSSLLPVTPKSTVSV
jgi:hypothetical protein